MWRFSRAGPSVQVGPTCSSPRRELHPERTLTSSRDSTNSTSPDASSVERLDVESGTTSVGDDIAVFHPLAAVSDPANGTFAFERREVERGGVSKTDCESPVTLAWEGITYRAGGKTLLNNVSGVVRQGKMVALMGLSGSGKTTLLNCLARHILPQAGWVQVRAEHGRSPTTIGYVVDSSNFFDKVTVRDTLLYKARLIRPEAAEAEVRAEVDTLIEDMSMKSAANTQVRDLSAGEMKRLSVAARLLQKPEVLILDEPLSGLDSANSLTLAKFLQKLVSRGVSVLLSLHQPRPEVYDIMDVVGLMHHGRMVFWGGRTSALRFLERDPDVQRMLSPPAGTHKPRSSHQVGLDKKVAAATDNDDSNTAVVGKPTRKRVRMATGKPGSNSPFEARVAAALAAAIDARRQVSPAPVLVAPAAATVAVDSARPMTANPAPAVDGRRRAVEPAHRVLDILSSLSGSPIEQSAAIATRFAVSEYGCGLAEDICGLSSTFQEYCGPKSAKGWLWRRFLAGLKISVRQVVGSVRTLVLVSLAMLALLTLTSNGFARSADTGAGLALALFVVASNTSYAASAYNMTGFASYLFVPYHDVVDGTQSVLAFLSVTVLLSLFHVALATALSLPMFFIMGIDGPPLIFPAFVAGVSLWVLGVFGFIVLLMGLDTLVNSCLTSRILHADELTARRHQQPAFFMFLGLYTLYGGILLPYENIPAGFQWVYYTNPATWFIKAVLTLSVCNGTSCSDRTAVSAASIDPILNVDKAYIGSFSADAEASVLGGGGGGGGGSNPIEPNAGDQAIVSQFDLESGSVASYLGVAALSATAPFVVAYVLLALHQVWLRHRVAGRPNPAAKDIGGDTAVGAKPAFNRRGGRGVGHHVGTVLLLAGLVVMAFVVGLPIVVFGEGDPSILPKFEEEVALSCPGCINGVPTAEYLEATPVTTNSRQVRVTLVTHAARTAALSMPHKEYVFQAGSTALSNTTSFNPTEVSDFLDITPRLGQDLSDEFVSLRNAEGNLLQALFESGNGMFYSVKTAPDVDEFPISNSTSLALLLLDEYNNTLEAAVAGGRLYRNRGLPGLGDLPGHNIGHNEEYVTMDTRILLYRNDDGELETLALQLGEGFPLLVKGEMDENCWSVAKALGRNSFIFQGTVERVAKTHFTGWGVFHMSTEKNLALDHPVRRFLDPHLHPSGLFENRATIFSPAGSFPFRDPLPERMLPLFGAVSAGFNWTEQASFRTLLETAGLDDLDDGLRLSIRPHLLLLQDSAREYADGVVRLSYVDDTTIANDGPLQAFALDLCSEDAGNIQGLCWGGNTPYGRGQGYPDEPPIASRQALSELLGDALSGIFLGHNLAHSRALIGALFVPFAPTSVRPNFLPLPDSVCVEQDIIDTFGDHLDWAKQIEFFANVLSPAGGHVAQFRGHYGGASFAEEKNTLFDVFVSSLEESLLTLDAASGLGVWEQMSSYIYA